MISNEKKVIYACRNAPSGRDLWESFYDNLRDYDDFAKGKAV